MNLFPRSLVLLLIVGTFTVLFLNNYEPVKSSQIMHQTPVEEQGDELGMVLGVSEPNISENIIKTTSSGFPKNLDIYQKEPIKKADINNPDLSNCIAYSYDVESKKVLFEKEAHKKSSIASITKLITALTFLDHNPEWDEIYTMKTEDRVEGGRIYLYTGEKITIRDLFKVSLVGSANTATQAMVHSTGMTEAEFVNKMNEKMKDMNLSNTSFADVTGISADNVSTAEDLAAIVKVAFSRDEIIEAVSMQSYTFNTIGGKRKVVYNTDLLLDDYSNGDIKIIGGKTGYTDAAGYCFVGKFSDSRGNDIVSVVLNTDASYKRFSETDKIIQWSYDSYYWPTLKN